MCSSYLIPQEVIQALHGTRIDDDYIITLNDNQNHISAHTPQDKITEIIEEEAESATANYHGVLKQVYSNAIHGFAAKLDSDGLQCALNDPRVESVEEDGIIQINVGSWGLDRIDDEDLPLNNSYKPTFGNGGEGVTAYIIDTGILASHEEFEDRATQEYNSAGGSNVDCNGHGTHVAGTIGAKMYGVASKAKLVGVKVLSCSGSGSYSGVIAGIDWVKANANKPATANMSLGGGKSAAVNAAVKGLVDSGVTTVVAAGNNNGDACKISPASEVSAITVGSTTKTDGRSSFSNWGACVDIFAPGSDITAPWIGSNDATRTISGTSMASPHVCGGVVLYLGKNPNLSPQGVLGMLLADSIADTITNVGNATPNKFLYVGSHQTPTVSPAPTSAPSVNPLLVEASDRVSEASLYELAYKLDVPDKPDFQQRVPYSPIEALPDELDITRIAYYMQLINKNNVIQWVWVSMDTFTKDILKIGVPTFRSKAIVQQDVLNLNIKSSLADINDYKGSGNIEFWPNNYGGSNIKKVKGATGNYDWGDERSGGGSYGSMQVHVADLSTTVFAFNRWNNRDSPDIGIGNADNTHTDWTFSQTGQSYVIKRLEVFVKSSETTNHPTTSPTKTKSSSPSIIPSSAPSVISPSHNDNDCKDLNKKACKSVKDKCIYGKNKVSGECKPKKAKYKHNCSLYRTSIECGGDNTKGLCEMRDGVCTHICNDLAEKSCKKYKNNFDNKKTCNAAKIKNPCKGCNPLSTCAS